MSEQLFYRLGKGSLQEAKQMLNKLLRDIGEVGVYLDSNSISDIEVAYRELLILSNIMFIEGLEREPGSVKLDFFRAYVKSKSKLVVSDKEISEYREEVL